MLTAYIKQGAHIEVVEISDQNQARLKEALWIDLLSPTKEEEKLVENQLNFNVLTKQEMVEIEPSSRLFKEDGALFMTATMLAKSESSEPKTDAVTFIITDKRLMTVRYINPLAFNLFISRLPKLDVNEYQPEKLFLWLLESTTERLAEILANVSLKYDALSQMIFHTKEGEQKSSGTNYKVLLQDIGSNGDLETRARESLVSFNRLISFFEETSNNRLDAEFQSRLKIISRDINALSDYASFMSNKKTFLLDTTLGMVNIEQNNIIKIFSVAAVIFLPPTLIASIYGMNFQHMPELHWYVGYPMAVVFMILSSWLPFRYFKKKKWL